MELFIYILAAAGGIVSVLLFRGPSETRGPRTPTAGAGLIVSLVSLTSCILPAGLEIPKVAIPLGIIAVAGGGLLFSNLPEPIPESKKAYTD